MSQQEESDFEFKTKASGFGNLTDRLQPLINDLNAAVENNTQAVVAAIVDKEGNINFHLLADRSIDMNRLLLVTAVQMIKMVIENRTSDSLEDLLLALVQKANQEEEKQTT